jgi:hypothetical protein
MTIAGDGWAFDLLTLIICFLCLFFFCFFLGVLQSCSKLHYLDISFNEETIETVATVVRQLPLLDTIVLKACYGGVEYPNGLERAVRRQKAKVRTDFDVVWDRF